MFKQLDLFAGIPDEQPKQVETKKSIIPVTGALDEITVRQDDINIAKTEEGFFEETPVTNIAIEEKKTGLKKEKHAKSVVLKPVKGKRGRKSLKEMEGESDFISIPEDEVLFKKQYYSIGEVSAMFQLNTSLLRYWETEFDILKPRKNRKGDRHFRPEDIKNLYLIHHLLRQRKYTIEGAKDYLKKNKSKAQQNFELIQRLQKLKGFLLELKAGL